MPEFNLKLLQDIQKALGEVRPLIDVGDAHISPASVKKINEITSRLDDAIVTENPLAATMTFSCQTSPTPEPPFASPAFLRWLCVARASVDDAQSFALQAAEPYVKEGFQVREDYWGGDLAAGEKKAVRQQLFKGNEYWFWLGTEVENGDKSRFTFTIRTASWWSSLTAGRKGHFAAAHVIPKSHRELILSSSSIEQSPEERTHWALVYGFR